MVVLAIVALAAVTVYPRLGVGGDQAALRTTVLALEARLRSARAAAVQTNAPQTFSIDTSARTYWSSIEPRPRALGRNVRLRLDGDGFEATGDTTHVLSFRGDGSAADVSIKLASGSRAATIDVDWLTGGSRIVWGP